MKLIVGYYSVFKNLRFCALTLIKCVSKTSVLWISTFYSVVRMKFQKFFVSNCICSKGSVFSRDGGHFGIFKTNA